MNDFFVGVLQNALAAAVVYFLASPCKRFAQRHFKQYRRNARRRYIQRLRKNLASPADFALLLAELVCYSTAFLICAALLVFAAALQIGFPKLLALLIPTLFFEAMALIRRDDVNAATAFLRKRNKQRKACNNITFKL